MEQPKDSERYTWQEYRRWPEGERWELIDGAAYSMSPSPSWKHQRISKNLIVEIGGYLKDKPCEVFGAPIDVKLSDEALDINPTVFQPDLLVLCDKSKLTEEGYIQGAPDIVIEIISPTSITRDEGRKKDIYELYGVREYWIVHPGDEYIAVYTLEDGKYGKPQYHSSKQDTILRTPVLEGFSLDLAGIF
jgi:Uma2 family endonuclease